MNKEKYRGGKIKDMIKRVNPKLKLNNNKSNNFTVGIATIQPGKAITLIALVITIIILLILSGVVLILVLGNDGILNKTEVATDEYIKQEASEEMNLKITNIQMQSYGENKQLPSLQYLADKLCEDDEMEYVIKKEKEVASLDKIDVSDVTSIFTKIKKYPYEFEIDSSLRLASIDGVKIENNVEKPNSQNTMSAEEHFTGEYYFNEKPIYSKTLYMQCPNKKLGNYNHNVDDVDIIWIDNSTSFTVRINDGVVYTIPHVNVISSNSSIGYNVDRTAIYIDARGHDSSVCYAYITIKYTKTEDKGNENTIPLTPINN